MTPGANADSGGAGDRPDTPRHAGAIGTDGSYLGFIDGLRAIAILAVVAFHIGLPAPSGGFFGVDIFFVISGFLIIGQIVADCEAGTFKFGRFWARRVLRILPSYLLVILCCMALAMFVLVTPGEVFDFSEEVMWSAGMAMNSWLIRHVGYFDTDGNVKVLLHLWSLAVEEQFYLVAPIAIGIFFLIARLFRRWIPLWIPGTVALASAFMWSFGLAMRVAPAPNSEWFFHTEHRVWEFIAGGAMAILLPQIRLLPRWVLQLLAAAGLVAVAVGIFGFTLGDSFPSWQTIVPVSGAALLLGAGSATISPVTRALSWRPLRGIGLVSYAWYLWHWPLMSLAYIANFGERDPVLRAVCAGVSLGLAVLTYMLLEQPLRRHRRETAKKAPWLIVGVGLAACFATMALGWWENSTLVPQVAAGIPAGLQPAREGPDGLCHLPFISSADPCLEKKGERPAVLLLGDSHAMVAAARFKAIAEASNSWLISTPIDGCSPFLDSAVIGPTQRDSHDCSERQRADLALLNGRATGIDAAIIEAQWMFHLVGNRPIGSATTADDHEGFVASMHRTIDILHGLGVRRVLVIAPIPLYPSNPPSCIAHAERQHLDRDICSMTRAQADAQRQTALQWLEDAVAGQSDVMVVDPIRAICDDSMCRPYRGDAVLYADFSHLGRAGVEALYAATKPGFDWLFAPN